MRLGAGFGISPVRIGPVRPVPYVFYNYNWGPDPTAVTTTREIGIDVEIGGGDTKKGTGAFVVGVAMIRESGQVQARLSDVGSYDGSFESTGLMVTFGFHFLAEGFGK
jgi:hypothetical protein